MIPSYLRLIDALHSSKDLIEPMMHVQDHKLDFRQLFETRQWFALREALKTVKEEGFYRGITAAVFHERSRCLAELLPIVRSHSRSAEAHQARLLLNWMYVREGNFREALLQLQAALEIEPHNRSLRSMRGFFCALATYPGQSVVQSSPSTIQFEMVHGNMFVPVQVNGVRTNFMLDSGATLSLITRSEAQRLRFRIHDGPADGAQIYGATGELSNIHPAIADRVCIGELEMRHVAFAVLEDDQFDFPNDHRGALGMPVLFAFQTLHWDSKKHVHIGFPGTRMKQNPNICFDDGDPVTEAEFNGCKLSMVLDTGNGETILWAPFIRKFAHLAGGPTSKMCRIAGISGDADIESRNLGRIHLRIGGYDSVLDPAQVLLRRTTPNSGWLAGRIGIDLLNQARQVTLDFRAMTLKLSMGSCSCSTSKYS